MLCIYWKTNRQVCLLTMIQISIFECYNLSTYCMKFKQPLQKFSKTAKGWYWQTLWELCCQPLPHDSGCQPVYFTCVLLYYAVKLYYLLIFAVNLCLKFLVANLYIVLVHYACVMFCPPISSSISYVYTMHCTVLYFELV